MNRDLLLWITIGTAWTALVWFVASWVACGSAWRDGVANGRLLEKKDHATRMIRSTTVEVPSMVPEAESSDVWS